MVVKLLTQRALCAPAMLAMFAFAMLAMPPETRAQQTVEPPAEQKGAPPSTEPDTAPPAPKAPAVDPSEAPATQAANDLVGLIVFSSDGTRVGEVRSVKTGPDGDIVALHCHTGGFLGFGGRIVAIPQGKFSRSGQSIRLNLDSDEVTGLPDAND
jgi:PRC-barrel domain